MMTRSTTTRSNQIKARLLADWARYLQGAAQQGAFTRHPISLRAEGISGPRAGALELYAGVDAPKLLAALNRNDAALLRQFVPWQFTGSPVAYMRGRYVRVEAGWPSDLAETMIRLRDLPPHPNGGGRWVAGKNETGATVIMGLNDSTPHYLVSGATGSGKTVALRSAVLQLAQDPGNRLVLVDGKMGEGLHGLAHLPGVVGPVAIDGPSARAALGWAAVQMRKRYESGDRRGRVVVVVDEFQELVGDQVFADLLRKLAAQGRAAGVHLLAATQHPTVDAFGNASTRRNLTGKLALRVSDPDASRVAVGGKSPRADWLLGKGDAYAVGPGAVHRVQMAFVDQADVDQASGGGAAWEFDRWPDLEPEAVGQDLPEPTAGWTYSGEELAHAIVHALDNGGRPTLVRRLQEAGLPRPGSERAARLLALGRECYATLKSLNYEVYLEYD